MRIGEFRGVPWLGFLAAGAVVLALSVGLVSEAGAGTITEFPLPTASSGPDFITAGPDGALWFTEHGASKIGRITTAGAITLGASKGKDGHAHCRSTGPEGEDYTP